MDVKDIKELRESAYVRHIPRWQFMLRCYDFLAGRQWTDLEIKHHKQWDMVIRTFNVIHSQIVTFDGMSLTNRMKPKAFPVEGDDSSFADEFTDVLQHEFRACQFERSFGRIITDAVISGWGYGYMRFGPSPLYQDGQILFDRLNPFDVLTDMDDDNPSMDNDRWRCWERWCDFPMIQSAYGHIDGLNDEIERRARTKLGIENTDRTKEGWWTILKQVLQKNKENRYSKIRGYGKEMKEKRDGYFDSSTGLFLVNELHHQAPKDVKVILDPSGVEPLILPDEIETEQIAHLLNILQLGETAVEDRTVQNWKRVVSVPGLFEEKPVIDEWYEVQGRGCAILAMECYDYDPRKGERGSVVSLAMDAQKRTNRAMALQEDVIKRSIFKDVVVPHGSIPAQFVSDWKSFEMGRILNYEPSKGKPEFIDISSTAPLIAQDFSINMDLVSKITGISPVLGGQKDSAKDGFELYASMVERGETNIKPILNNAQKMFKDAAQFAADLIQTHYWAKRWIRVVGKSGNPDEGFYVNDWDMESGTPIRDLSKGKFDVEIDGTHMTKVERQARFMERQQLLGLLNPMMRDFSFNLLLEYSGWGDIDKWLAAWKANILIQYAPHGETILRMLESGKTLEEGMQQGLITPDILSQIRASAGMSPGDTPQNLDANALMNGVSPQQMTVPQPDNPAVFQGAQ